MEDRRIRDAVKRLVRESARMRVKRYAAEWPSLMRGAMDDFTKLEVKSALDAMDIQLRDATKNAASWERLRSTESRTQLDGLIEGLKRLEDDKTLLTSFARRLNDPDGVANFDQGCTDGQHGTDEQHGTSPWLTWGLQEDLVELFEGYNTKQSPLLLPPVSSDDAPKVCRFADQKALEKYFDTDKRYIAFQSARDCASMKQAAFEVLLCFHPDKLHTCFPGCSGHISGGLMKQFTIKWVSFKRKFCTSRSPKSKLTEAA